MKEKKHLSFGSLIHGFRQILKDVEDRRQDTRIDYPLTDIVISGFASMYFQDPSLLQFQKRLEESQQRSNLTTLFGVEQIPESTQLRSVLDELDSEIFSPVFEEFFSRLQRGKHLEQYQFLDGAYLCSMDGTQYFSSKNISCSHCLSQEHKSGEITYSHKVLQGAVMHPEIKQVIPLMAEDIRNEDGTTKQDCETNAAKRFINRLRNDHPQLPIILLGDSLFSKQPMIQEVTSHRMHYIFGVKPKDHKILFEWLGDYDNLNELRIPQDKGKVFVYRWMNDVPLNGREDALSVNFLELTILAPDKQGGLKTNYHSCWVSDLPLCGDNIELMVRGARCRWKIENECFNTLKNQGYHLEHNFGHGKQFLSFNFYLLTLLAFFFHQVFELTDHLFQACREKCGSKQYLWEKLRSYITLLIYDSWTQLLEFILTNRKFRISMQPP